jgi:hypothetical protein
MRTILKLRIVDFCPDLQTKKPTHTQKKPNIICCKDNSKIG